VSRHVPIRTCLGCGQRAPQRVLLRVAFAPERVLRLVEPAGVGHRTGYLHDEQECWDAFGRRKGQVRSLGASVDRSARLGFVDELKRATASGMMR
jgi:predicted RNA-binding protein YlxR (DUF448 family)